MTVENHAYVPCEHEGRHGYTLRGEPEYQFCERCRRGPEAHAPRPRWLDRAAKDLTGQITEATR